MQQAAAQANGNVTQTSEKDEREIIDLLVGELTEFDLAAVLQHEGSGMDNGGCCIGHVVPFCSVDWSGEEGLVVCPVVVLRRQQNTVDDVTPVSELGYPFGAFTVGLAEVPKELPDIA